MCPVGTISVIRKPTDGRLDGMQCYSTATSMEISNATPMKNVSDLLVVTEAGELGLMGAPGALTVCLTFESSAREALPSKGCTGPAAMPCRQCDFSVCCPCSGATGDVEHQHCAVHGGIRVGPGTF